MRPGGWSLALIFSGVLWSTNVFAQATAHVAVDSLADCQQPFLRNFPVHFEGTATLSASGLASMDSSSTVEGHTISRATLGGRPMSAPGGSTALRVTGRHGLRATREYPNNYIVADLKVVGNSCSIKVEHRLKPGMRQYTFLTAGGGWAYCDKPRIVRTTCTPQ
jgi:hypothetical protein